MVFTHSFLEFIHAGTWHALLLRLHDAPWPSGAFVLNMLSEAPFYAIFTLHLFPWWLKLSGSLAPHPQDSCLQFMYVSFEHYVSFKSQAILPICLMPSAVLVQRREGALANRDTVIQGCANEKYWMTLRVSVISSGHCFHNIEQWHSNLRKHLCVRVTVDSLQDSRLQLQ